MVGDYTDLSFEIITNHYKDLRCMRSMILSHHFWGFFFVVDECGRVLMMLKMCAFPIFVTLPAHERRLFGFQKVGLPTSPSRGTQWWCRSELLGEWDSRRRRKIMWSALVALRWKGDMCLGWNLGNGRNDEWRQRSDNFRFGFGNVADYVDAQLGELWVLPLSWDLSRDHMMMHDTIVVSHV